MTSEVPEEELAERVVHDESADPEEYEADERETAVSDETGTVYDVVGETETTPNDEEIVAADEE